MPPPATPAVVPGPPPGLRVGPYALLARLGEGGMGVVHLARGPDGHRLALKVLRPHIVGDDEARHRLAREVGSLRRIRSRYVAEIIDADPWGPIPYVATRYVPGPSLHDAVRADGPVEGLAWFAARLAEGIGSVHAVGVLHRDVKPSNVLLEGRMPILIDFGLARVADDPRLTHTGWLLGTPGFLAPEILYGEDATTASDVHAWGATVAYAGLGAPPFGRGPAMAVMDRVRRGQHDLGALPAEVRGVVEAALDPRAEDRPTLTDVLRELAVPLTPPRGPAPPSTPALAETGPLVRLPPPEATERGPAPRDLTDPQRPTHVVVEKAPDPEPAPAARRPSWTFEESAGDAPTGWQTDRHTEPRWPEQGWPAQGWPAQGWPGEAAPGQAAPGQAWQRWVSRGHRWRALALDAGLVLVVVLTLACAPYAGLIALVVAIWLLRAGSLSSEALASRRSVRGRRWHDRVGTSLGYPWHLLVAVPGVLLTSLIGGSLGLAAGLIGYAATGLLASSLLPGAAALVAGVIWGPGGSRFAGPVRGLTRRVSISPWHWAVAAGVVVIVVATVAGLVSAGDVTWQPADGAPPHP